MKKKLFVPAIALVAVFALSLSALALSADIFTDQGSFATWYKSAALKMKNHGIINGYADGSFGATNNVNRAELAVILDKFATVLGKNLVTEPTFCTEQYVYGLTLNIYDQNGSPISDAQIGAQHYPGLPSDTAFDEGNDLPKVPGRYVGLGEGDGYYTITITKIGYATYTETIKLEQDECHVIPQTKTIILPRLP